jgi:hypothetical protein
MVIAPVQTRHDTTTMTQALSDREEAFTWINRHGGHSYQPGESLDFSEDSLTAGLRTPRGQANRQPGFSESIRGRYELL